MKLMAGNSNLPLARAIAGYLEIPLTDASVRRFADEDGEDILHLAEDGRLNWSALPSGLDPELRGILERMLAPNPRDRYADTNEVGHALEYYIYRSGYGPTVVTLEQYLSAHFTALLDPRLLAARGRNMALLERTQPIPTQPPSTTDASTGSAITQR